LWMDGSDTTNDLSPIVVYAADDQYALLLGCSIRSLASHASTSVCIVVLDCGLSKDSQEKLKALQTSTLKLSFASIDEATLPATEGVQSHVSKATWAKLRIPYIIEGRWALYVDCDTLLREDISSLW